MLLLIFSQNLRAQLCQGSLGDPIINITFGAGPDPGAPLTAAATGYQYVSADCPGDGYYTVRSKTVSCFSNTWHTLNADHTGNANGYFMLVNASIQPSAFYLDTVRGLCGNTTYEFAAWVVNVIRPESCSGSSNQPNLTFRIEKTDGTLLQTYNTGNIAPLSSPVWNQYGFFFTTPPNVPDVVLRIINNAPGGCGNDLGLDDITFRACGPQLFPTISGISSTTASVCEGIADTFYFTSTYSAGFINPSFQWQQSINGSAWLDIPGANTLSYSSIFPITTVAGSYAYRLAVAESGNMASLPCRVASEPLIVQVNTNPVVNVINNGPVCSGSSLVLTSGSTGAVRFDWTGPNGFLAEGAVQTINNILPLQAGTYFVTVTNTAGCQHRSATVVAINPVPLATTSFSQASICAGDSVMLIAGGGISYLWIPATGLSNPSVADPRACPQDSTRYMVIVTDGANCTDSAFIDVTIIKKAAADAGPDKSMLLNESVQLSAAVSGNAAGYYWTPSPYLNNPVSLQPIVNPPVDTKFIFNAVSAGGCGIDTDTVQVIVYNQLYIPNAFTPNSDNINDTWNIPALGAFKNYELSVFNRFGEMVFHLKNENKPWDGKYKGKPLSAGVYAYVIDFKRFMSPVKGTVMIIR